MIAVRDLLYFLDAAQGREWALSHLSAEARNDFPQITSWPLLLTPPFRDSFDTTITRILSRGRAHCECLSRVPMGGRGREAKGEWTPAHESAQVDESEAGSWIHAYLHRKEGDQGNAAYWYRRAGKPVCRESLQTEWISLAAELLE